MLVFSKTRFIEECLRNGGLTELDNSCIDSWVTFLDGLPAYPDPNGIDENDLLVPYNSSLYDVSRCWCIEK